MKNPLTWLSRKRYRNEPLIRVEISRSRLLHNLTEFQAIAPDHRVAPVLKSNAYGHGLSEIAHILKHAGGIPFFVVDSYFEAVALRADGIRKPLLIIGYTRSESIRAYRLKQVSYTIGSLEQLREVAALGRSVTIHIKIDTGMRRQGIMPSEISEVINIIQAHPKLMLEGICSHLATADEPESILTTSQIRTWNESVRLMTEAFPDIPYIHLAATDGHRYGKSARGNVSRLGLGLYGLLDGSTFEPALDLKPVLSMITIITGIKKVAVHETIGYGGTFRAEKPMTVATIPVGYYEGLDRRLSSKGVVQVGPRLISCLIVGRVSMNISSIDVGALRDITGDREPKSGIGSEADIKNGTTVTVISRDPKAENSLMSMARLCGTITYELAVHIPAHLRRVIVD